VEGDHDGRMNKTIEMTMPMQGEQQTTLSGGKIREMAHSLEHDRTPSRKLKHDFGYEYDEKKISEDKAIPASNTSVRNLVKEFQNTTMFTKPSPPRSSAVAQSDFSTRVPGPSDTSQDNKDSSLIFSKQEKTDVFFLPWFVTTRIGQLIREVPE
jgi:hypothetical protein